MKTLYEILNEYLDYQRALNFSSYTVKNSKSVLLMFINYLSEIKIMSADKMNRDSLMKWQVFLSRQKSQTGLQLKPRTINTRIGKVKMFIKFMVKRGYAGNQLEEVLEYIKEPHRLPKGIVKHADMQKLLKKIETGSQYGYRDRTIMELMYTSGMRAGEVTNLDVNDVDLVNGTAKVFGKGSKERVVPIGETAIRFIETYIKAIRPFLLIGEEKDALFINKFGRRLLYGTLFRIIHRHCDKADMGITCHTFRRSCTTEMIRGGANIYHVKEMLGHENLNTLQSYVKLSITDLKKTHNKTHPRERDD